MVRVIREKGKFYRDLIQNPFPVIICGSENDNKILSYKLRCLNIKIEKVYDDTESFDLAFDMLYMILITSEDEIQQYKIITEFRKKNIDAHIYLIQSFLEYDFQLPFRSLADFRKSIPWFYNAAYHTDVTAVNINRCSPYIPLLFSPKGYYYRGDYSSNDFNVTNKTRKTVGNPIQYEKCIYMFGDSRIYGQCLSDQDTIPSKLQLKINRENRKIKVVNCSVNPNMINNIWRWIEDTSLREGDIVVLSCLNFSIRKSDWNPQKMQTGFTSFLCMRYINKINELCHKYKTELYILLLGTCYDIQNPSLSELYLLEAADKTIFYDEEQYGLRIDIGWIKEECRYQKIKLLDYSEIVQRPHNYGELFIDTEHYSPSGTALISESLYGDIIRI